MASQSVTTTLRELPLEAKWQSIPSKTPRVVLNTPSFIDDVKKYAGDSQVIDEIEKVRNLFIDRKDTVLEKQIYHNHDLDRNMKGFKSIRLGVRDIVIVYKSHNRGNQIDFHRIDSHDDVYSSAYDDMERERKKRRYRQKD